MLVALHTSAKDS